MVKRCTKCLIEKGTHEFNADNQKRDGLRSHCKSCRSVSGALYRAANAEKVAESVKAWHSKNKSRVAKNMRAYHKREPVKSAARRKAYQAKINGRITVPDECEECGGQSPLDMHHDDYSKPLDVRFLCKPCHWAKHTTILT